MKNIIKQASGEEAEYFCDVHPDRRCASQIQSVSWYGSKFDLLKMDIHLCDECMQEFYEYAKRKYKTEPIEIEI